MKPMRMGAVLGVAVMTSCFPASDPRSEAIRDAACVIAHAEWPDAQIRTWCSLASEAAWAALYPLLANARSQTDAAYQQGHAAAVKGCSPAAP